MSTAPRSRLLILFRESRWAKLAFTAVVWSAFLVIVAFATGPGSKLKRAVESSPMAFLMIGVTLAADARRRRGTTLRCAACDYDLTGAEPGEVVVPGEHEARCPECGSRWGRAGMTVRGERLWSWRAFTVAALCMVPFFAYTVFPLVTGRFTVRRTLLSILPTGSLIEEVSRSRSFTMDDWAELNTRTLSPAQHTRLVRQLMDRDALSLHAWSDGAKWLAAESAAGRLTDEERGLMLRRLVGLTLQRSLSGPRDEWTVMREGAWGLAGAFSGWTIFAAAGEVKDASGAIIQPPVNLEIPLDLSQLAAPPANYTNYAVPAWPGVWRSSRGISASVWLIAEPRTRPPGAFVPAAAASDAVVVRVDLASGSP